MNYKKYQKYPVISLDGHNYLAKISEEAPDLFSNESVRVSLYSVKEVKGLFGKMKQKLTYLKSYSYEKDYEGYYDYVYAIQEAVRTYEKSSDYKKKQGYADNIKALNSWDGVVVPREPDEDENEEENE